MNKPKILIVDDRKENLYVLKTHLRELDVEIIEASNGNNALKESLHHDFALAILDVQMPVMDGYELAEILHDENRTRNLPIIFLTAVFSDEFHVSKGYSAGAIDFISKPYKPKILLSKAKAFIEMDKQHRELKQLNKQLQEEIQKRKMTEEELKAKSTQLEELNNRLEERVKEEIGNRIQKEQMLIHQAKHAAMGEMIGAIAHQWRQPLNSLGLIIQDIEDAFNYNELSKESLEQTVQESMRQITFMSNTIDDFRNFFKKSKEKESFKVREAINDVVSLLSSQLKTKNVSLDILIKDENWHIYGFKNEFEQVVLNVISNAKDAILKSENKEKGKNFIEIKKANTFLSITVEDNGGGVPEELLTKVFDPYFTTKGEGGTGIGLYMAKTIIEKNMNGKLQVSNNKNGAVFTIQIPENNENELC